MKQRINEKMEKSMHEKLKNLNNPRVIEIVEKYVALCEPDTVTVIDDSDADAQLLRDRALAGGEEHQLTMNGHTWHFDGPNDQARDKAHTKLLVSEKINYGFETATMDRQAGLDEIEGLLKGIMKGKEMFVRFCCLGPAGSPFAIHALQLTDSAYVAHSEDLLYRRGYEAFKNAQDKNDFFVFVHSAGELENGVTKNIDKRRIYVDLDGNRVFSINNQYAGNSVGLKKLAFRLAIARAHREGWLAEHMFLMGVHGKPGRTTYFSGAYPSACGKTSTAMIPGQSIVGDDIIYAREFDGVLCAVNVERGIFGIIENVNAEDDPEIFNVLTNEGECIFSNVLVSDDGVPYWLGSKVEPPAAGGKHYTGRWTPDMKDVPVSHKNARYTIGLEALANRDRALHDPAGVKLDAMIYGGRDSDTSVPVLEARSWAHGVLLGACIESETTAATLGQEGVRKHNPYANLDFMPLPLAKYVADHLAMEDRLKATPKVFVTNYFLKDNNGRFLNHKLDKKVWILWAEARVHGEVDAIETPVGFIPKYEDLKTLFKSALNKDYSLEDYNAQFTVRIDAYRAKWHRMAAIFDKLDMPEKFSTELKSQLEKLG
ncbi:MAG: phosphoenolpyruvate carboxykinase (GTP) [Proteobacteria bacterium]|nr:phosphoenolpyruvate carboxykinase (GTP) [Pseudomonadota bacterium]